MSVFHHSALTISVILILFVIGWILQAWKETLGHRKPSFSDAPSESQWANAACHRRPIRPLSG